MRLKFVFAVTALVCASAYAQETTDAPGETVVIVPGDANDTPATEPASNTSQTVVIITETTTAASETPVPEVPVTLPVKGLDMASVEAAFGTPSVKNPTVGGSSRQQPPITRWDYPSFSVIFEYDHVVDVVQRSNPAPIQVFDGLAGGPKQTP